MLAEMYAVVHVLRCMLLCAKMYAVVCAVTCHSLSSDQDTLTRAKALLEAKRDIREGDWGLKDVRHSFGSSVWANMVVRLHT